jgi:hypothetical protein
LHGVHKLDTQPSTSSGLVCGEEQSQNILVNSIRVAEYISKCIGVLSKEDRNVLSKLFLLGAGCRCTCRVCNEMYKQRPASDFRVTVDDGELLSERGGDAVFAATMLRRRRRRRKN